jgi:hypothetical protein
MTKTKNPDLQKVFDVITNFVEGQLSRLPPGIAAAKRKQVRQILSSASQPGRKKKPKRSQSRTKRPAKKPGR